MALLHGDLPHTGFAWRGDSLSKVADHTQDDSAVAVAAAAAFVVVVVVVVAVVVLKMDKSENNKT